MVPFNIMNIYIHHTCLYVYQLVDLFEGNGMEINLLIHYY